jgi:hypothetical protein
MLLEPAPSTQPALLLGLGEIPKAAFADLIFRYSAAVMSRSFQRIDRATLNRLSEIAKADLEQFVNVDWPRRQHFLRNTFCIALCQGAALHYVGGKTGVHDFDVYTFFEKDGGPQFPPRRRKPRDFGPSQFGRDPGESDLAGRRVDLMGRSILRRPEQSEIDAIREYLKAGKTRTARCLRQKAVVILDPVAQRGVIAWPLGN